MNIIHLQYCALEIINMITYYSSYAENELSLFYFFQSK